MDVIGLFVFWGYTPLICLNRCIRVKTACFGYRFTSASAAAVKASAAVCGRFTWVFYLGYGKISPGKNKSFTGEINRRRTGFALETGPETQGENTLSQPGPCIADLAKKRPGRIQNSLSEHL